jgi:hypothetical protein
MNNSENKIIFQAAESPPEAEDIHLRRTEVCGEHSFYTSISREFYIVVGQAMRQRRTGSARGGTDKHLRRTFILHYA